VYLGTRDDKKARDIRREDATAVKKPLVPGKVSYQRHHRMEVKSQKAEGRSKAEDEGQRTKGKAQKDDDSRTPSLADVVAKLRELEDARKDGDLALPNGDSLRCDQSREGVLARSSESRRAICCGTTPRSRRSFCPQLMTARS
jgi:hypothetical protein